MGRSFGVGVALAALVATGCTSVKVAQRDGCWVRRTEKAFGRVIEEVGPCGRAEPKWAQDRLTRLVQECVAQADWRWQARALEVWSRGLPYPTPQPREDELLRACMDEMRTGMETEADSARLKDKIGDLSGRIAEVSGERDTLRGDAAREHARLADREDKLAEWLGKSHDKVADWLGQAAQKPPGEATATVTATSSSTSDGKATTTNDSGTTLSSETAAAPPGAAPVSSASVVLPPGVAQPVTAPSTAPVTAPAATAPAPAPATVIPANAPPAAAGVPLPKRAKRARKPAPLARPASRACAPPAGDATPCAASAASGDAAGAPARPATAPTPP